jgi:two-component system, NtrC family, nitrogen regulation sensor histidine kinase NtrY
MAFKHYNRLLMIRLIALVALAFGIGCLAVMGKSLFLIIFLSSVEVILVAEFVHFLNSTNRQITFFIQAIKNDDTTLRFPIKTGSAIINDLHKSLNELNVILQKAKVSNQIRERYFSEILQHIGAGVLVLNDKGFITEVNPPHSIYLDFKILRTSPSSIGSIRNSNMNFSSWPDRTSKL